MKNKLPEHLQKLIDDGARVYYIRIQQSNMSNSRGMPVLSVAIIKWTDGKIGRATCYCCPEDYPPVKTKGRIRALGRLYSLTVANQRKSLYDAIKIIDRVHPKGLKIHGFSMATIHFLHSHNGIGLEPTEFEQRLLGI